MFLLDIATWFKVLIPPHLELITAPFQFVGLSGNGIDIVLEEFDFANVVQDNIRV